MRKSVLILFVILSTLSVSAQDTLTVMAKSGVFLRSKADVKSTSLEKITYGEKVVTVLDTFNSEGFVIEEIKDFFVSGRMIRVNYKGTEGYVFSGFLTKFPMPASNKTEARMHDLYYLQTNFTSIGKYDVKRYGSCEGDDENCICSSREKFEGGIEHYFTSCSEIGNGVNITIPKMSIVEAYFMAKSLYLSDYYIIFYDKSKNEFTIRPRESGPGCEYFISEKNGIVKIKYECGC
ncbi:MAG: hypothetical protein POELPBGB_01773 [Bacteroidia bacterium]|nr:hypothetical protein [Bacteroidia bacterium]